jgi:hypothetical protein
MLQLTAISQVEDGQVAQNLLELPSYVWKKLPIATDDVLIRYRFHKMALKTYI